MGWCIGDHLNCGQILLGSARGPRNQKFLLAHAGMQRGLKHIVDSWFSILPGALGKDTMACLEFEVTVVGGASNRIGMHSMIGMSSSEEGLQMEPLNCVSSSFTKIKY